MLMFLYPLAMVLIVLSVASPLFHRDGVVYFFVAFPAVVSQSSFGLWVAGVRKMLPLASMGLSWVVPALVGLVVGLAFHFFRHNQVNVKQTEVD